MNDYIFDLDDTLKHLLLSQVILKIDEDVYKQGTFISFTHNYFNLNITIQNPKKVKYDILKLPLPFNCFTRKNIIYFDYKIKTFSKNNPIIEKNIMELKKPYISKFYDKIVSFEVH